MPAPDIPEEHYRYVAAETRFTLDEIEEAATVVHELLQEKLLDIYEDSYLSGGLNRFVADYRDSATVAFSHYNLHEYLREGDVEMDDDLLAAVAAVNLEFFQSSGLTVSYSRRVFKTYRDTVFYPMQIEKPDMWLRGEGRAEQRLHELLLYYEMSAAEALDYWGVVDRGVSSTEWARRRRVGAEAVRKNVRAAKEQFNDEELGRVHDVNQIRPVRIEDVPDDFKDDERVYIPTDEQIDAYKQREEKAE